MGAGIFVAPRRLLVDFPLAALRDEVPAALGFELERPLFAAAPDRALDALRALLAAPVAAADRPRDFVLFDFFLLPLRVEALRLDFPRDFLALVAIDALLGVSLMKKPLRR